MSRGFLVILAVLALAFAAITGLAINKGVLGPPEQTAAVGGPFHLTDQAGRPADQDVLKGKWSAVFFGYTNCPDACPTTLFALGQAEKLLGPKGANFQTVFVSVDPARDTVPQMAKYLSNEAFPRHAYGLTGTEAQTAEAARAYKVFVQKAGAGADYSVNHSTFTYLMNPRGRFACVIPYNATPQEIAAHVQAAMAQGARATSC
jgi:protein SCO1/2